MVFINILDKWLRGLATMIVGGVATCAVAGTPLTVVTEEFAPYSYVESGEVSGYSTEVVRAALARAGIDYSIQIYPWARALQMATARPNVLIYSIVRTPQRENQFQWIAAIAPRNVYLYKLAARQDIQIHALADLKPYRIAANRGDVVEEQLHQLGLTADLSAKDVFSLQKLIAGRVDLMVATELSIEGVCQRANVSCALLERGMQMPEISGYYVAASLGTPVATVQRLRQAFVQLRNSDAMRQSADKYGVTPVK
ncbi:transporter substrate-binding domain-containing protein [Duganella dendranthematis]|jgi:polar amino acid transport system substrate-binding protein|uniref:Transporter substrate-binding domain-containing protein n=1 Tax=Duganella dendranthematis TaxID=2728021 RepID=A0ABX6MDR1_9BURK|nr:transporter substrate-binding domain-containing protein [Duganella dendranthematis]QJD92471.1 transporter substrate-binding domain-containing protein [Duganella dendranthematis]